MQNKVTTLEIKNFKSIKHLQMNCKRLNVFIGEPNVGKSNILEALALFSANYSQKSDKFLSEFIRYEQFSNLFYDDDLQLVPEVNVKIDGNYLTAFMRHHNNQNDITDFFISDGTFKEETLKYENQSISEIEQSFEEYILNRPQSKLFYDVLKYAKIYKLGSKNKEKSILEPSIFKKYYFSKINFSISKFHAYLMPPNGDNLFHLIRNNLNLKKEITGIFAQRGLDVVFSKMENTIDFQKKDDENIVYKYPFSSTADTFQRLVFYLAVIESNKNSVLILEEPEVHSFPPYTTMLAERILEDVDNQYFIATHSPYLLGKLVEKADFDELNICIAYYENYETKVKILNEKELQEVVDYSTDLFFNLSKFTSK